MDSSSSPTQANHNVEEEENIGKLPITEVRGKRKESSGASNAGSRAKKQKKTKKTVLATRSQAWEHFTRFPDNRDKCTCNYCRKPFVCPTSSGTSNLTKHLAICKHYQAWEDGQRRKGKSQAVISEEGDCKNAKVPDHIVKEATDEMIVIGGLPLSFSESEAWKYFSNNINLCAPHSRRTCTRNIVQMYVQRKKELRELFLRNKQRVSLTRDIWVAKPTGASYMVITLHYVDEFWRLKKFIIGFRNVIDHRGKTISAVLLECLAEWGIEKLFSITVDNAIANTSALRRFHDELSLLSPEAFVLNGDYMHVRCCAHIINLIVKEGLAEIDASVTAIRNAITYVRSSTPRLESFQLKVASGRMTRGSLPLDVSTRWNSTYTMLLKALKYRLAFDKMREQDNLYLDWFKEVENGKKRVGPPTSADWNAAERLNQFLILFYDSTLVVSASQTLNSYKCYGEIVTIERNLMKLSESPDPDLQRKAEGMFMKFDKYWDGMKGLNKMLVIASIFDPRKKMGFAKLCFERLYGIDSLDVKELQQSVMATLRSMFDEYQARYEKVVIGQSSQHIPTASQMSSERVEV